MVLLFYLLTLCLFVSSNLVQAGPKIVIDQDGGADDAMAIFIALIYEEYFEGPTVVGLTTVNGNVNENQVFENAQRILGIARRRDIPIHRGATKALVQGYPTDHYFGLDGLGDLDNVTYQSIEANPEHAANALIDMSKKYTGELTVVAIGPVTNIALAISMDPGFINRLAHLYVAAGNIYSDQYPDPEFNARLDVEAYYVVAENATPEKVTFIPFSPFYESNNISMYWRDNVLGAINTAIMQSQLQFERISNQNESTWNFLDPQAMSMALDNNLIKESRFSNNSIILCGDRRGINTNDFTADNDGNAKIAFPVSADCRKSFLYKVFSAELK